MATPTRQWLTVKEFRERTGLGKSLTYDAVQRGELPSIRIGGKILLPSDALDLLLDAKRTGR